MSVADEILRIQQAKSDLAASIENKGVTVPAATTLDGYAALVDQIQQSGTPVLPYDAKIEYIQSSGTQYIDIGITGNSYLEYEVKYLWSSGEYGYILGAQTSDTENRFSLMTGTRSNRRIYYNNGDSTNQKYYALTAAEMAMPVVSRKVYNNIFQNSSRKGNFTNSTYDTPVTISVFARHQGTIYNNPYYGNLYYLKIGNLDLIPVRKGQVGYLYDKVSNTLFGNAGTGSFTLGPDVT